MPAGVGRTGGHDRPANSLFVRAKREQHTGTAAGHFHESIHRSDGQCLFVSLTGN